MSDNRYELVITHVFVSHYQPGLSEIEFDRDELNVAAAALGLEALKNLGDIIYTFRYRSELPEEIRGTAERGLEWVIRPAGTGRYCFAQVPPLDLQANTSMISIKIPDSTPGLIEMYAQGDEQALLARIRYNRLLDTFLGITCYSLQNHLRTTVPGMGQLEADEVYVGVDDGGVHYVLPVEAKAKGEKLGRIQFEQDLAMCEAKFPELVVKLIGACAIDDDELALFELCDTDDGLRIRRETHYRLVPPEALTAEEVRAYRSQKPST